MKKFYNPGVVTCQVREECKVVLKLFLIAAE